PGVIDACGTPAPGEDRHADGIVSGMPDVLGAVQYDYAGKRIAVVGSGYSAGRNNWRLVALIRVTDTNFTTPQFDTFGLPRLLTRPCLASPLTGPPHWSTFWESVR